MVDGCEDVATWTAQQKIDAFKEEYIREVMADPHVTDVRFCGSAGETWRWRQGHSNVDIIIEGDDIPRAVKMRGIWLLRDLNYKYCLKLEDVPFYHPTPLYVDNTAAKIIGDLVPKIQFITEPVRSVMKRLGAAGKYPVTHGAFWDKLEDLPRPVQNLLIL